MLSGAGGLFVGAGVLSTGLAEPLVSQVPLDPIFTLGGLTLVFAAAGWLVGPSIGGQVFYMLNRRLTPQIKNKEGEFLTRIKKHRVDPSNSSAANPGLSTIEPMRENILLMQRLSLKFPTSTARRSKACKDTDNG